MQKAGNSDYQNLDFGSKRYLWNSGTRTSAGARSTHTFVLQGTEARTFCCSDRLSIVQCVNRKGLETSADICSAGCQDLDLPNTDGILVVQCITLIREKPDHMLTSQIVAYGRFDYYLFLTIGIC